MSEGVTYGGYLQLKELLACQQPQTAQHDELLFVILHQTMELWMKQMIHEIGAAQGEIRARQAGAGLQTPGARLPHPSGDDTGLGHSRDDDAGGLSELPPDAGDELLAFSPRNSACSNTSSG